MTLQFNNRSEQLDYVIYKFISFLNRLFGTSMDINKPTINIIIGECFKYLPEFKRAVKDESIDVIIENVNGLGFLFDDLDEMKEILENSPEDKKNLLVYIDTLVKILSD